MAKKTEIKKEKVEREYVIPLRCEWKKVPRYKKANKAIKAIKEFLVKHMKIYDRDLKKIKIDTYLNEFVWFRGIKKPPAKVKIKAIKEGENVRVKLAELPKKLKFKKAREEKRDMIAEKSKKSPKIVDKKDESEEKAEESAEKKKDEKEKVKAVAEATKQLEKTTAKKMKHQTGGKVKQKTQPIRKALAK